MISPQEGSLMNGELTKLRSKRFIALAILSLVLVSTMAFKAFAAGKMLTESGGSSNVPMSASSFKDVATFGVGSGEAEIGIENDEESAPWGPSSFAIDKDGSFYVVDGVNSKILVAGADGVFKKSIELNNPVICPVDI